jgi:hypothetical protein
VADVKARVVVGGWYWAGRKQFPGDPVEASERQIAAWEAGGYVERVSAQSPAPAAAAKAATTEVEEEGGDAPEEGTAAKAWPHKITPEQYLNRFPDGPDADLARSIRGQTKE